MPVSRGYPRAQYLLLVAPPPPRAALPALPVPPPLPLVLPLTHGKPPQVWSRVSTAPSREPISYHDHEPRAAEVDGVSCIDAAAFREILRSPPVPRQCTRPHARTMASAFMHDGCLYITGGRDRKTTIACDFYIPLPARPQTLLELVAQYIVDHGIPCEDVLPPQMTEVMKRMPRMPRPTDCGPSGGWDWSSIYNQGGP